MLDFGTEQDFIKNYEQLKSSRKMAELYNCSRKSITNHATKIGYDYSKNKEKKISLIPPEEVYELYLQLGSLEKVGKQYNCSGTSVGNYLKQTGYQVKNAKQKLSDIPAEEFIEKYNELKSAEKMGKFYGCSSTAVLNHAHKIGYDPNSNKDYKLSKQDKQEIIGAYSKHSSVTLAKKYNVSRGMITKTWYDNGLTGKKPTYENNYNDLTGKKIGYWTVLEKTDTRYKNGCVYWLCRCDCGEEREISSSSLVNGLSLSCGYHSNISKGNEKIKKMLQEAQISYEIEKKFSTCKDKKELPFDFYVNNQYLIEYDGEQHYQKDSIFDYEYTHGHDLIKSKWCKDNHIPLIRIPYTHFKELELKDLILETSDFVEKN